MKIIFFGTPEISVPFLEMLYQTDDIEIVTVVTKPDKPVGRKQEIMESPVKQLAEKYDINVLQPKNINSDFIKKLKKLDVDFNIVIAYGEILPKEILDFPKHGSVNVHFSLLPKYRGAAPVQTALLNGDKETGIAIMDMNEKLDAGGLYFVKKIGIEEKDTSEILLNRMSQMGAILLPEVLRDINDGVLSPIYQEEANASYCKKITKANAQIHPNKEDAEKILNKYRAFQPWPGIFMIFKNKRLKILEAEKHDGNFTPGELRDLDGDLVLGTTNGTLKLNKVQMEGKTAVSGTEFINGFL